ncbi:MAG: MerR family DNA-binding transcriptional regulator [Mycobacterium sp.]|jgi:DNA-binding transcriptional MerR regulator/effector-binding domain-containing protein|nr:MerR family DNA-binding transcriptional regulator [Mycobacterium sp.]
MSRGVPVGLTIGDFSRATQLSVKTLRHYHDVGPLEPDFNNPGNGYRHYSPAQVPVAQVIRRLRDLDMPIPEVKAVLGADDATERNALIAVHLNRLEDELARTRAAVDSLRKLIEGPRTPPRIEHRTIAETPAIAVSAVVEGADILAWWQGALGELYATVQATQGLRATGPAGGLFAGGLIEDEHGQATVFIPVEGSARTIGRVQPFVVPGAEVAVMMHRGDLADVDLTYGALGTYAAEHELSVDGPLRETYLRDAHDSADPARWETEIGWPIFAVF